MSDKMKQLDTWIMKVTSPVGVGHRVIESSIQPIRSKWWFVQEQSKWVIEPLTQTIHSKIRIQMF